MRKMENDRYWKLARPNDFDFYTGNAINYRKNIGGTVKCLCT